MCRAGTTGLGKATRKTMTTREHLWNELKKITTEPPAEDQDAEAADHLLCYAALAAVDGRQSDFEMFREKLRELMRRKHEQG
jgi:hypothetical protein